MRQMRFYAVAFGILAVLDTVIQIAMKLAARFVGPFVLNGEWIRAALRTPWVFIAVAGYLITFVAWMTILDRAPVGPAFAASHLQVVTVLIASVLLFHETLTPRQLTGAICIVSGIALLALRERTAAPAAGD